MKLKNLFAITLSIFLSTQVVMGATYRDAVSKIKKYEVPSVEQQQKTTELFSKDYTVDYWLQYYSARGEQCLAEGNFIVNPKEKVLVTYVGWYDENVVVPSTIAGVNIETIDYEAFSKMYNLKNIVLPEGVKTIKYAFGLCSNLESITVPSTVEKIDPKAFSYVDTVYFPYHTPEQLNSLYNVNDYNGGNEIFGARRAVYGTGENQVIIEDKNLTKLREGAYSSAKSTNTKNESAKSVKLKVGEKVATVNGVSVALDTPAYINSSNNSVYVPLRFVSVALVGEDNMMWDASTKTVAIFKDSKSIKFTVGNNNMIVDGKAVNMGNGVVPEIKNGSTYVPFRPLGEALGMNVKWDNNTKTAIYE